ncbi:hypothetical protein KBX50_08450 [Micromonospora sp. C51]|uniref:hypothetical protein n=1 Tax=Micromonospora sp. C51 TaxID=2824879 RepID=UPI001B361166|nr:hypothetical protein [Micromonospora sp. C51]MBQ1048493.1 hypothetical protein [Micromonospora sp. C51]
MIHRLREAGYTVDEPHRGRRKVRLKGALVGVIPDGSGTLSYHAWGNCLSQLRARTGIDLRPQRSAR